MGLDRRHNLKNDGSWNLVLHFSSFATENRNEEIPKKNTTHVSDTLAC